MQQLAAPMLRGKRLPLGSPRIDWSNPITRGLRNVWVYGGGNIPTSLVNGERLALGTVPPSREMSQAGGGFGYDTTRLSYMSKSNLNGLNPVSLFVFVTPKAATASQRYFSHSNGSSSISNFALGVSPTIANAFRAVCTDSSGATVSSTETTGSLVVGKPVCLSANFGSASGFQSLYVDGVLAASPVFPTNAIGTLNATAIGGQFSGGVENPNANATVHMAAEWTRALSPEEHKLLGQNPTCFLIAPEDDALAVLAANTGIFSSGAASVVSVGSTVGSVTVATPANGTSPFTYQWYRSTASGFTPGGGNVVAGATNRTLNDTGLTNGTTYYYKNVVTDSASATAVSNEVSLTPAALAANGVSFSSVTPSSVTVTAAGASGGSAPYSYQFQRAPDVAGSPGTFADVGTAGTATTLNNTGLTAATKYWYRVVVTDAQSVVSTGASSTVTTSGAAPIVAGVATMTATGDGTVTVASTAPTGGQATLSNQWYRSTYPAVDGAIVSGATSLTLVDTGLVNGTPYYYKLVTADGFSTAKSNQVAGTPAAPVYLGCIGDSYGTTTCASNSSSAQVTASAAGNLVGNQLEALFQDGTQVTLSNQCIGGTNALQWAPGSANLTAALNAFQTAHANHADWTILIHLGGNDSSVSFSNPSGGESPSVFLGYMTSLVNYLISTWGVGKVVLVGPPFIGDISANHTQTGVSLLSQYFGVMQQIAAANPGRVYATQSEYAFIMNNQQFIGGDLVHPTPPNSNGQGGSVYVAGIWAKAVYEALRPVAQARSQVYYRLGLR